MDQTVQSVPRSTLHFVRHPKFLSSWKEIAAYMGKGVRTVQRWELEHALPIRRPNRDRRIVIAIPAEIDAWVTQNQVIAMPAEIDAWLTENQDVASDGKGSAEEQLAEAMAEVMELRKQVAELRAELNVLREAQQRSAS